MSQQSLFKTFIPWLIQQNTIFLKIWPNQKTTPLSTNPVSSLFVINVTQLASK